MNQELTDFEKKVLFEGATEAPFSGELLHESGNGTFHCKNCGALLFDSDTKFDSGSGWPSFTNPANTENVNLRDDISLGAVRTEVSCKKCGGHLGHVFADGPHDQGGMRYCVNSASLAFEPQSKQ
jgi:peptide-methionine (R)-S-oxide reductase